MCKSIAIRVPSLFCKRKAILTIETALVLPVFLIVMMLLTSISTVYYIRTKIDAAVYEETKYAAMKKFDDNSISISNIEVRICDRLGDKFLNSGIIKNGRVGLDFTKSDLTDKEIITVCIDYHITLPFDLFGMCDIPVESAKTAHTWVGYIDGLNGLDNMSDYVYMTENGTVYHFSRECSYIRLSIRSVNSEEVSKIRNDNGLKYKKCIYCKPKKTDGTLYVTSDGDKYHNKLSCSGLKRTVFRVRKSQLEGVKPCSRCGR